MDDFKKHKWKFSELSSQSPDLNITENLWLELKHAVSARLSKYISELEVTCRKSGSKKRVFASHDISQTSGY